MAVTATTGIARVAGSSRRQASAAMPSSTGSWMSIRMSAGRSTFARRTPSSPAVGSWGRPRPPGSAPRPWAHGKAHGEGRSLAELALQPDGPAVQLDEPLDEAQAEPGPFDPPRAVGADLAELLEDRRLILRRDPDPGVADGDLERAVVACGGDLDATPLGRELHGVGEEVHEHLLELA